MWNTWRKAHTFNAAPLAEVEAILNAHLTPEERQEALNRPSAAATAAQQADPRKRAAPGAAAASPSPSASPSGSPAYGQEPSVKKAKLQDPRRPPVAAVPALSTEAAALDTILSSVDVQSRVPRELLERMRLQLRQPMAEAESKALIVTLVQELQQAMNMQPAAAALPAPPGPPLPATLPPPLPIPATLPPLPAMPLQPFGVPMQPAMPPIGMPMAPAPLPLPMQPHPFAGFAPPVSAPPAWNQPPPVQPPVHASPPAAAMGRTHVRAEVCVTTRCNHTTDHDPFSVTPALLLLRRSLIHSFDFLFPPLFFLFSVLSASSTHHLLRRGHSNVSNHHKLSRRAAFGTGM